MVKTSAFRFQSIIGHTDIDGKCGDKFTINGSDTFEVIGYTDGGASYVVRSAHGQIFRYVYKAKEG